VNDRLDCLVCGRLALPSGEPSCQCLTHSLSRPVAPPRHGPDPADVARFPLDVDVSVDVGGHVGGRVGGHVGRDVGGGPAASGAREETPAAVAQASHGAHRKPRHRTRIVVATGGAVAAVVGCTALAASLLGGQGRPAGEGQGEGGGASQTQPDGGTRSPRETDTGTGPDAGAPVVLRKGDEGPQVVELQQRLAQLDWIYDGDPHGTYDIKTWLAVARFQSAFGVSGDPQGVYGPLTRAKLEAHTTEP
jgi:putative peptidoglycan binding protein